MDEVILAIVKQLDLENVDPRRLDDLVLAAAERYAAIAARHEQSAEAEANDFENAFDSAEHANDKGLGAQVRFLIDQLGLEETKRRLRVTLNISLDE